MFGYDQSALAAAKAAAKLDKENAAAATLVGVLSTEDDESAAQVATTGWDAFVERTLTPLQSLIIPVLAVLLAGFLLARLLVVVRPDPHRVRPAPFGAAMIGGGVVLLAVGAGVVAAVNGYPTWSGLIPASLLSAAACGAGIAALIVLGFGIVSDARRSLLSLLGLVAAGLSGCCLVWGLATQSQGGPYWLAPLAVLVGLPALALLAMTWASRLRLTIDARKESGKTDEILSGQVIALLAEMAGGNPKGLEVPRGVDLSVLSNIPISGLPEGKFAAALTALWQTFFALTPWQIRADISGTSTCSVVITRNGRTVQTAIVDRTALGLEPLKVDDDVKAVELTDDARNHQLQVMVCAITLITLATRHRGFDGLLGAQDWRSIGLHYVATKDAVDIKQQKRLLAAAVHQEPTNVAAQVALRHAHNRESHERAELMDYATWLAVTNTRIKERVRANAGRKQRQTKGLSGGGAGNWLTGAASEGIDDQRRAYERDPSFALRLRMLNTLLSVYCNANAPTDSDDPNHIRGRNLTAADHGQASGAVDELVWMITCAPESSRVLAEALKISVATSAVDAFATKPVQPAAHSQLKAFIESPGAMVDIGPYSAYNLACHFAASSDFATAIKYLKFADADDYLVGWRDRDPWLVDLRQDRAYHEAFDPKKRADIFALAPFEGLEKDLLAGGLGTGAKIAAAAPAHLATGGGDQDLEGAAARRDRRPGPESVAGRCARRHPWPAMGVLRRPAGRGRRIKERPELPSGDRTMPASRQDCEGPPDPVRGRSHRSARTVVWPTDRQHRERLRAARPAPDGVVSLAQNGRHDRWARTGRTLGGISCR